MEHATEHFIETVRKYPCLWNTTSAEYRDQELKDSAWAEVVKETGQPSVKEVKLKWKKLRDSYRDALKRQSDMLAKEPHNHSKKNYAWKYMGAMQFLQPHMSIRKKPAASPPPATPAAAASASAASDAHNGDARSSSSSSSDAGSSPRRRPQDRDRDRDPAAAAAVAADHLLAIGRKLDYLCRADKRRRLEAYPPERKREPPPPAPPDPLDIFFNGMCQTTKRFPYPTQVKIKKTLFNAVLEAEEALIAEQQSYASLWARGQGSSSSSEAGEAADAGEAEGEAGERPS